MKRRAGGLMGLDLIGGRKALGQDAPKRGQPTVNKKQVLKILGLLSAAAAAGTLFWPAATVAAIQAAIQAAKILVQNF